MTIAMTATTSSIAASDVQAQRKDYADLTREYRAHLAVTHHVEVPGALRSIVIVVGGRDRRDCLLP